MNAGALVSERTRKRHQRKEEDPEEKFSDQDDLEKDTSDCSVPQTLKQQMEADPVSIEDLDDQEVSADFKDPEIFVEIDCKSTSSNEDISTQSDDIARIEENDLDSSESESSEPPDLEESQDPIWDNLYDGSCCSALSPSYVG